ncbi:S-adenosyl-L-methionine-dependent methyltransferase [Nemania sp. FL0031]|nr:S-adenosyl-L-methionine-dependent methyltransferase [Nemania sp. FL0031]
MMADGDIETDVRPARELGYSVREGANWTNYQAYRHVYPVSFFHRIYTYHSEKLGAGWSVAHDIGAGAGIASSALAKRFNHVVVSDPNEGYTALAQELLVQKSLFPESKFTFLEEPGEKSSVPSSTVDLITVCECIHWMKLDRAIQQFARQLAPGGTIAITLYSRPLIEGNERAEKAYKAAFDALAERTHTEVYANVYEVINSALDNVGLPGEQWGSVKRVYINAQLGYDAYKLDDSRIAKSNVKAEEEQIWEEEEDVDWCHLHGFEWLRKHFGTYLPYIPPSEI